MILVNSLANKKKKKRKKMKEKRVSLNNEIAVIFTPYHIILQSSSFNLLRDEKIL